MGANARLFAEMRHESLINQVQQDFDYSEKFTVQKEFKKVTSYEFGVNVMSFQVLATFEKYTEAYKHLKAVQDTYSLDDARRNYYVIRPVFEDVELEEN